MRIRAIILPNFILSFLILSLILSSCLEELGRIDKIEKTELGPWVDFPLVNSEFNAEEFLTKGESKAKIVDQQGLLVLVYDDSLSSPPGTNFFTLPTQTSPTLTITGTEVTLPPGGSFTISKNMNFGFNTAQGEVLDSIWVIGGQIVIQATSSFPANVALSFSIPSFKKPASTFQQNLTLNGGGSQSPSASLQGFTFDLTSNGTATNTLSFGISATITDTGTPIGPSDELRLSFVLSNTRFRALFGELGNQQFQMAGDSINIDIFNNVSAKNFELLSPLITLNVKNSFGLPVGFDIQNFSGIKADNSVVPLSGPAASPPLNPYLFAAPTNSQIGQSTSTVITLNSANSNLGQLIGALPRYLVYQFDAQLNPGGASTKNFVLDTSRVKIDVHAELPFHAKVEALVMSLSFDFDGLPIEEVDESYIKVKTVNEFPMDANVQVYFTNNAGAVFDSLFVNPSVVEAAPVDANGFTVGSSELISTITVNQAKIDRIDLADKIVIRSSISTSNNGSVPVKFSVTDRITIAVGVHTRLRYPLN